MAGSAGKLASANVAEGAHTGRSVRKVSAATSDVLRPETGLFATARARRLKLLVHDRSSAVKVALLHLVYRQLYARDSVLGKDHKPQVDLVMFPEYSIHVDDQDLMRAFSDATGAMLFYGLLGAKAPGTAADINAARWLVPQRRGGRRSWVEVDQGKWHLTSDEEALGVAQWRPYQVVIELRWKDEPGYRISGAICCDATDIALAADLKDESHMVVVAAMNKDVKTFDSMVAALRYPMYQHVLIVNSGEFGGSIAQAPNELEHTPDVFVEERGIRWSTLKRFGTGQPLWSKYG